MLVRAVPLYVAADPGMAVVTWDDPRVPGARRGGPVVACTVGRRLGRHGRPMLWHLTVVAGLGAVAAVGTTAGVGLPVRLCGVLLIAAVLRTVQVYRRTAALADRIEAARTGPPGAERPMRLIVDPPGRATLTAALGLADRIWAQRAALAPLVGTESGPAIRRAVWEIAGALERRERLLEIRTDQASRTIAGLPPDSPAVHAHHAQAERAERAWAEINAEVRRHVGALQEVADRGERLIREWEIGAGARRAGSQLDALGAPDGPGAAERYAEQTAAVVAAYRELAGAYGGDLYV